MTFAEKLAKLRKAQNYTQEQLADLLGVSRQSVSKWESGLAYPETEKLIRIGDMFDCSIDYLLKDSIEDASSEAKEVKASKKNRKAIAAATAVSVLVVALLAVAFIPRRAFLTIHSHYGGKYEAIYREIGSIPYLPSETWWYIPGTWNSEEESSGIYSFAVIDCKNIDKYTVGNKIYAEGDFDRLYLLDNSGMYRIFIMESYTGDSAEKPAVIMPVFENGDIPEIHAGNVRIIPPNS